MKRIFFCMLLPFLAAGSSHAQGIYKTEEDFKNNKLSYQSSRINADILFNAATVKVTDGEQDIKLPKAAVYGYQNKKKQDFRFFNNESYRIVRSGPFMLYERHLLVVKGKEKTRETRHYFSINGEAPLQELTKNNLKNAWPMAYHFHDLLDIYFKGDGHLLQYDKRRGEYRVMRLFEQAEHERS